MQQSRLFTHEPLNAGDAGMGGAPNLDGSAGQLSVSGSGPVTPVVVAAIDERPIGGASLNGGTTGGGTYADSLSREQLYYVDNVAGIRDLIGSDTPMVLLIAEGTYNFSTAPTNVSVCTQACSPTTPLAQQTTIASNCTNGETKSDTQDDHEFLRFGSNKTLIGMGKGATFNNAMISLSNVTNIILRNLVVQDVVPNINGVGYGINLWPGDHIWVDHCTFRNIGHGYVNIQSSADDPNNPDIITAETGYITITHNNFDGKVDGVCGQRSELVLGTNRDRALTMAYNWFNRSSNRNPFLFGPETWAHVFNNYWSDIDYAGLAAACGSEALLQGNVFESTTSALSINNNGSGTTLCATNPYGKVYAPMNSGTDEDNLFDSTSTLTLHSQPTDGTGLTKPARISGHRFTLTTPTDSGASTETYEVTLNSDPTTVPAQVKAIAGAGTLF